MATFPAFLDTCTLFGAYLCDTLLRLAEAGTFCPQWSLICRAIESAHIAASEPLDASARRCAVSGSKISAIRPPGNPMDRRGRDLAPHFLWVGKMCRLDEGTVGQARQTTAPPRPSLPRSLAPRLSRTRSTAAPPRAGRWPNSCPAGPGLCTPPRRLPAPPCPPVTPGDRTASWTAG